MQRGPIFHPVFQCHSVAETVSTVTAWKSRSKSNGSTSGTSPKSSKESKSRMRSPAVTAEKCGRLGVSRNAAFGMFTPISYTPRHVIFLCGTKCANGVVESQWSPTHRYHPNLQQFLRKSE